MANRVQELQRQQRRERSLREERDTRRMEESASADKAAKDAMYMQGAQIVGQGLLDKRTANIAESEAKAGIKSKQDVGDIAEGTNLYTSTKKEGATGIKGRLKQTASNMYENVTGNYIEQNPAVLEQVRSKEDMTDLYGSTAAEAWAASPDPVDNQLAAYNSSEDIPADQHMPLPVFEGQLISDDGVLPGGSKPKSVVHPNPNAYNAENEKAKQVVIDRATKREDAQFTESVETSTANTAAADMAEALAGQTSIQEAGVTQTVKEDHDINMQRMILDQEANAKTYVSNREQQYKDRMDLINRKERVGKYSDPNIPINPPKLFRETDPIEGEDELDIAMREGWEAGADADQSGDTTASAGTSDSFDASGDKLGTDNINEELPNISEEDLPLEEPDPNVAIAGDKDVQDVIEESSKDLKLDDVAENIKINTRDAQLSVSGAKDAVSKGLGVISDIKALGEGDEKEQIEVLRKRGLQVGETAGKHIGEKVIEKGVKKTTAKIVEKALRKTGEKTVQDAVRAVAAGKAAASVVGKLVAAPASVVTGGFDIASGVGEAERAAEAGDEIGQGLAYGKQASGGASIIGGVMTGVGALMTLFPPTAPAGVALMGYGTTTMGYGAVGSVASTVASAGSEYLKEGARSKFKTAGEKFTDKFKKRKLAKEVLRA